MTLRSLMSGLAGMELFLAYCRIDPVAMFGILAVSASVGVLLATPVVRFLCIGLALQLWASREAVSAKRRGEIERSINLGLITGIVFLAIPIGFGCLPGFGLLVGRFLR